MVKQFIPPKKGHVGNLVMVRNPRFHVWSALARPDGYPDKIVWAVGIAGADQFAPVASGEYDVAAGPDLQFDARLAREQIAHPSQVHTFAGYGTQSVFLNTTIPRLMTSAPGVRSTSASIGASWSERSAARLRVNSCPQG
jgi:hypothetical protein